jgi:acetate kinase
MMGSRSGSFDPGAIFYLLGEGKMRTSDLEHALNKESGLKGISGVSSDTREIEAAIAAGNERAAFALDLFAYKIRWHIGALVAVLGGIDALSFTGPAGEHSAGVRARVCRDFAYLGIELDPAHNDAARPDCDVATSASRVRIAVIRTLEEWAIARLAASAFAERSQG